MPPGGKELPHTVSWFAAFWWFFLFFTRAGTIGPIVQRNRVIPFSCGCVPESRHGCRLVLYPHGDGRNCEDGAGVCREPASQSEVWAQPGRTGSHTYLEPQGHAQHSVPWAAKKEPAWVYLNLSSTSGLGFVCSPFLTTRFKHGGPFRYFSLGQNNNFYSHLVHGNGTI